MRCLSFVGSLKMQVSFAEKPCKRDDILVQKSPVKKTIFYMCRATQCIWAYGYMCQYGTSQKNGQSFGYMCGRSYGCVCWIVRVYVLDHIDIYVELLNTHRPTDVCVSTDLLKRSRQAYGQMCQIIRTYASSYSMHTGIQIYAFVWNYSKKSMDTRINELDHMDVYIELLNAYRRTDICVRMALLKSQKSRQLFGYTC